MSYIQKYPLKSGLEKILRHDQLPKNAVELGRHLDSTEAEDLHVLIKRNQHLSVLVAYIVHKKTGDVYNSYQYDFPLKVLSWFPKALEEFRKSPAESGLHAGAMSSVDENIDGEMLCVQRATDGYDLVNRSRNSPLAYGTSYMPTSLPLSSSFLYDLGYLDLWKDLGEKYEKGLL